MQLKFKHFIFLNVLDASLTYYALKIVGLYELNPLYRLAYSEMGLIFGLVAVKSVVLMVMYTLISSIPSEVKIMPFNKNGRQIGLALICLMFVFVVANNIYQIIIV